MQDSISMGPHVPFHSFLISLVAFPWVMTMDQSPTLFLILPSPVPPIHLITGPIQAILDLKHSVKIGHSLAGVVPCHWAKHHKMASATTWDMLHSQNHCLIFFKVISQVSVASSCRHYLICALSSHLPHHGQLDTNLYCHLFMFFPWPKNWMCISLPSM